MRVDINGQVLAEPQKLIDAPNALTYAFLGAVVGSLVRPVGGWLSDRFGGARVTHWDTLVMIISTIGVAWCVMKARMSPQPGTYFLPFLLLFLLLFVTTGIGNGSTFRMIPVIFPKEQAGPVLGWTSAIAAYGAFLIPTIFATQIKAGTPEYALYGFVVYYIKQYVIFIANAKAFSYVLLAKRMRTFVVYPPPDVPHHRHCSVSERSHELRDETMNRHMAMLVSLVVACVLSVLRRTKDSAYPVGPAGVLGKSRELIALSSAVSR